MALLFVQKKKLDFHDACWLLDLMPCIRRDASDKRDKRYLLNKRGKSGQSVEPPGPGLIALPPEGPRGLEDPGRHPVGSPLDAEKVAGPSATRRLSASPPGA